MIRQDEFNAALLDPTRAVPEGLVNPDGVPATKRFDVYRNNVAVGLSDALETAFPVIRALVGDAFFRAMAGVYLRKHPPHSPLMMFYGEDMPGFLEAFEPAQTLPYLPDMARLELAIRRAYHAADATPIDPAELARIPEAMLGAVVFGFAPSSQVIASVHPLHDIWAANAIGAPPPRLDAQAALVTRPEFDPIVDPLSPGAAAVLNALLDGETLGRAVAQGGPGFDLGPLLSLLLTRRAITKLTFEEPANA